MPSSMTDFINTFLNLKQVQNQSLQIEQRAKENTVNGLNTFMSLARNTANPMELSALAQRFSDLGVGTMPELTSMLAHVTPTQEAIKSYQMQKGIISAEGNTIGTPTKEGDTLARETANTELTGMNAGGIGQSSFLRDVFANMPAVAGTPFGDAMSHGAASRAATGMTPGQQVVDAAIESLPAPEIQQAAGIKTGTRMSAPEDANNQLGWAGLRETGRRNTNEAAYQTASVLVDAAKANAVAKGHDPEIINQLINAKVGLMGHLEAAKNKVMSTQEKISFIGGLNSINARLREYGQPTEEFIPYDANALVKPGVWEATINQIGDWRSRLFGTNPAPAKKGGK